MTLTITLPPLEEVGLQNEADALGQSAETLAGELLAERLQSGDPQIPYDPAVALAVLDSFLGQEEAEHKETLAILRSALDADRPGQRSIFGLGINPPSEKRP